MSAPSLRQVRGAPERAVPRLTPAQLAGLREQLDAQYRFRIAQLDDLRRTAGGGRDEVTVTLHHGARSALADIVAALGRLADGSYGACTRCGAALPVAGLEVLPQVGQCVPCRGGR